MLTVRPASRHVLRPQRRGFGDTSSVWNSVIDTFRALYLQADQEQRVILVNNHWHLLHRAARKVGTPMDLPAMQKLDAVMAQWWGWKQAYDEAVLRRWVPFTRSWGTELDQWAALWEQMVREIDAAQPKLASELDKQHLTADDIRADAWSQAGANFMASLNSILGSSWFVPLLGTLGFLVVLGMGLKLYKGIKAELPRRAA